MQVTGIQTRQHHEKSHLSNAVKYKTALFRPPVCAHGTVVSYDVFGHLLAIFLGMAQIANHLLFDSDNSTVYLF